MKRIYSPIIRSACALVVGVLLVVWPEAAMLYLVITIGVLFLIPGVFSLVSYFIHQKDEAAPSFPVAAVGSMLFGMWLMIIPAFFVSILMYVLGALLVLAGIQLLVTLIGTRQLMPVAFGFYVIPVLILLAGLLVLVNPFATASIPFIILGASCICYALSDLLNYFRFRRKGPKTVEDAVVLDETPLVDQTVQADTTSAETAESTETPKAE